MTRWTKSLLPTAPLLVAVALFAACNGSDSPEAAAGSQPVTPSLSGSNVYQTGDRIPVLDEISVNEVGTNLLTGRGWVEFYWDGETLDWQQPGESDFYRIVCISVEPCAFGNSDALEDDGTVLEGRVALWKFNAEEALKLEGYATRDFWSKASVDLAEKAVDVGINSFDQQPLHWAIEAANHAVVPVLLRHGVPVSRETLELAFTFTSLRGRAELVRLLLEHGADPDWQVFGQVPLTLAIEDRDLELVKALLAHEAAITQPMWNVAITISSTAAIVEALIGAAGSPDPEVLEVAIRSQKLEIVDVLLANGVPVTADALVAALRLSHIELAAKLLVHNPPVSADALAAAVAHNDLALVESLLKENPPVEERALRRAIEDGDVAIIAALLRHDPPISEDSLLAAISRGDAQVIETLLNEDPPISEDSLLAAILLGDAQVIETMLERGPTVTPNVLHLAVRRATPSVIYMFLAADPAIAPETALAAVRRGDLQILQALLVHDPLLPESTLNEALEIGDLAIIEVLIARKVPIGEEAVDAAVRLGDVKTVRALLERDGPIGPSAVSIAIRMGHQDILEALLARDATLGQAELRTAYQLGDLILIETLLAAGADANWTVAGLPALFMASQAGDLELTELLIRYGADVNQVMEASDLGWTVLEGAAFAKADPVIIRALLDAGAERRDSCAIARKYNARDEESLALLCP